MTAYGLAPSERVVNREPVAAAQRAVASGALSPQADAVLLATLPSPTPLG